MRILFIHLNSSAQETALAGLGFVVDAVHNAEGADAKLDTYVYDIVIFDVDLAKGEALVRLQRWQHQYTQSHFIVLASKLPMQDRVNFLNAGADCYLLKPGHLAELLARVRGLARRVGKSSASIMRVFDLEIDMSCRVVKRGGRPISLTPREYALLRYLALHKGQIVSRSMILEHVYEGREESNVINVYIRYLRNKIDRGHDVPLILTRYGRGYMLRDEVNKHQGTSPLTFAAG